MLSLGSWISLPASLTSVLTYVDGRCTDLGVFLAAADLLVLRDGAALMLVLPPEHSWPSEGDRQEALRRGDRLSLPRLQLVPRANCLNWELPVSYGLPGQMIWREPVNRPISAEQPVTGVISREELRHQLAFATAIAISTPTLDDSPASKGGEGRHSSDSEWSQPISSPAEPQPLWSDCRCCLAAWHISAPAEGPATAGPPAAPAGWGDARLR